MLWQKTVCYLISNFSQCCVNRNVLELAMKYCTYSRAEQFDFSTNELRKAAYRQFVVWKYGKLRKGVRKVNPACSQDGERGIFFP